MTVAARSGSLAARLVGLFVLGSFAIMATAGYALYHALGMQLDAHNAAELAGKTEVVSHILRDIDSDESLRDNLGRLAEIQVGHPHLTIGVLRGGRWLVGPVREIAASTARLLREPSATPYMEVDAGGRSWWLHPVRHRWTGDTAGGLDVVLAIETTDTRRLLRQHALVAVAVVVVGTLASALLAWFVARRGLAPLSMVAERAEQVTAQRLGARLDLHDAPREVHGLAESINGMLQRLEQSFQDLEGFSADIAHELRTPINNLLLQTQVTLSRPRNAPEYQEALHTNLLELERLRRMVEEMLFLARADRRLVELEVETIDIAAEASSVAEYFEAYLAERSLRLRVDGGASVRSDRSLVRRALTNVMSNAARYAPDGSGIQVSITAAPAAATVAVANAGDVPSDELQRLFTRFARRDQSRGRDREGAGLGLSIVASIMQLLGGSVHASSAGGKVTFILHIPDKEKLSKT